MEGEFVVAKDDVPHLPLLSPLSRPAGGSGPTGQEPPTGLEYPVKMIFCITFAPPKPPVSGPDPSTRVQILKVLEEPILR
jgi:hypothetical protein